MPDMKCPLGEDCDLTLAYMAGAKDAKDTITRLRAENAKLRAALEAWYNACQVDALMSGPIVKVSHIKAQNAWTLTCAALNTEKEKKG